MCIRDRPAWESREHESLLLGFGVLQPEVEELFSEMAAGERATAYARVELLRRSECWVALEVKLHAKRLRLEDGVWEFYVEYEGQAERRWVTERDSAFPERFRTLIDDLNRAQKETINFGRQKVAWVSIARRISLVPAAIRSHSRRASRSSRASTSKAESSLTASRTGTDPSAGASFGAPGEPSSTRSQPSTRAELLTARRNHLPPRRAVVFGGSAVATVSLSRRSIRSCSSVWA